jgi:hypothetical protein
MSPNPGSGQGGNAILTVEMTQSLAPARVDEPISRLFRIFSSGTPFAYPSGENTDLELKRFKVVFWQERRRHYGNRTLDPKKPK